MQRVNVRSQSITFFVKSLHIYGSISSTEIGISSILRNKRQLDRRRQRFDESTYLARAISVDGVRGIARTIGSKVANVKRGWEGCISTEVGEREEGQEAECEVKWSEVKRREEREEKEMREEIVVYSRRRETRESEKLAKRRRNLRNKRGGEHDS